MTSMSTRSTSDGLRVVDEPVVGGAGGGTCIEPLGSLPFPLSRRTGAPHLTVIVPAFNEELVVEQTYLRLRDVLDSLDVEWSLLFVNDGSRDGTNAILESLYERDVRVSYLILSRNFGHQAAVAAGLENAVGDVFLTMDADLQHPPELIAELLEGWREGYDVIHTRKLANEGAGTVRSLVTRVAYRAIGWVANVPLVPHASDFRLLDREARDAVNELPEHSRLYRGLTPWVGYRQGVLPYVAGARANGTSNYGLRQLLALFTRSFFDFSSAPLYAALILGTAAIVLCFGYTLFVLVALAIGKSIPPGYVSIVMTVVFLSSVNLTLIGVLSVYVSKIYDEVRGRPTYVIARSRTHAEPGRVGRDE
jgi:polyisoprenyl-phosphate glycosyltransferase